jgi:enoyl-CoA hydratase
MRTERANVAIPEIVLDHPPVNALRSDDFLALAAAVATLGRDPATRVIILRSDVEKAFAAGVDVHEMTEGG